MSESIQPGLHPDPDLLNAFIEGVLPEHERVQCLTHLAECPSCREVVYLAQEPLESEPLPVVPAIEKVSFWKRWVTPIPVLSAATAAGILVLSFALYQHFKPAPNAPEMVAMATHPTAPAASPQLEEQPPASAPPAEKVKPRVLVPAPREVEKSIVQQPVTEPAAAPVAPPPVAVTPAAPEPATAAPAAAPPVSAPRPLAAFDAAASKDASSSTQTGIAGTITDPTGTAIAGAAVKLRPLTGPDSRNLTSDPKGQFNVAGLEPGQYELQVMAPGFKSTTKQVDLQPNQMARADSTLSLGSVADSISVMAEVGQVQTSTGAASAGAGGGRGGGGGRSGVQPLPARSSATFATVLNAPGVTAAKITAANQPPVLMLPNKLPAKITAVSGKLMLAADSAGALFLSENSGREWKTVKPVWHGKVASLAALPAQTSPSDPAFQLTTDSNAVWLSRDGSNWYAAPAPK